MIIADMIRSKKKRYKELSFSLINEKGRVLRKSVKISPIAKALLLTEFQ